MQSVSQATEIAAYVLGSPRSRADQIARALINAGILPKSSGRAVKKISAREFLPLIAAIALADKVVDAPDIARQFEDLPFEGETSGATLADVFAKLMKRGVWKRAEIELSKQPAGYTATIRGILLVEGKDCNVTFPFWRNPSWGGWCKTSFTISAEGVKIIRNLFERDDIKGMEFKISTGLDATA